jgi:hypothetical protein
MRARPPAANAAMIVAAPSLLLRGVLHDDRHRWSQVAPATAPGTITAPMAMNQVRRVNTTPIVP